MTGGLVGAWRHVPVDSGDSCSTSVGWSVGSCRDYFVGSRGRKALRLVPADLMDHMVVVVVVTSRRSRMNVVAGVRLGMVVRE